MVCITINATDALSSKPEKRVGLSEAVLS